MDEMRWMEGLLRRLHSDHGVLSLVIIDNYVDVKGTYSGYVLYLLKHGCMHGSAVDSVYAYYTRISGSSLSPVFYFLSGAW